MPCPDKHVVTGSRQINQSMNRMIAQVIQELLCVLPMRKKWHFRGKFDQHLLPYCGAVNLKLQTRPGYWFLWKSCETSAISKITDNFGIVSSKIDRWPFREVFCSICGCFTVLFCYATIQLTCEHLLSVTGTFRHENLKGLAMISYFKFHFFEH